MIRWWWVRHGPTHEKAFVGHRDVPADLSDTAQLARLHDFLPANALVVASDLCRASDTADAIAGVRRRLPNAPLLREFDFGDWDGQNFIAVSESHPQLSRDYWENPGDVAPPNGESWNNAAHRAHEFVDRAHDDHSDTDIIAVAHFGIIMTQIERASGWPATQVLGHNIDNLSVTKLTFDGTWRVEFINHIP